MPLYISLTLLSVQWYDNIRGHVPNSNYNLIRPTFHHRCLHIVGIWQWSEEPGGINIYRRHSKTMRLLLFLCDLPLQINLYSTFAFTIYLCPRCLKSSRLPYQIWRLCDVFFIHYWLSAVNVYWFFKICIYIICMYDNKDVASNILMLLFWYATTAILSRVRNILFGLLNYVQGSLRRRCFIQFSRMINIK